MSTLRRNLILLTDSYKLTQHRMQGPGLQHRYSYQCARHGARFPNTLWVGLQGILGDYLEGSVITQQDIDEAYSESADHFGDPTVFNRTGWNDLLRKHDGRLPLEICSIPEGMMVPPAEVMMTVMNTDPEFAWLVQPFESLLQHTWYPAVVATLSHHVKTMCRKALEESAVDFSGLPFMLHDFGFRAGSSAETSTIGGAAHLFNFNGTDTPNARRYLRHHYAAGRFCGLSVPASEHSNMTERGEAGELDQIRHILKAYPKGIVSIVSDSYDIDRCIKQYFCEDLRSEIQAREGRVVVRPDSGEPIPIVLSGLTELGKAFGYTINRKGFKVLSPQARMIWGDGLRPAMIQQMLTAVMAAGWSVENLVFGMGGGLIQDVNRDTQRMAFKCSAVCIDGIWHDVFKRPKDMSKASRAGLMAAALRDNRIVTVRPNELQQGELNLLQPVFRNGLMLKRWTFDEVVARIPA